MNIDGYEIEVNKRLKKNLKLFRKTKVIEVGLSFFNQLYNNDQRYIDAIKGVITKEEKPKPEKPEYKFGNFTTS